MGDVAEDAERRAETEAEDEAAAIDADAVEILEDGPAEVAAATAVVVREREHLPAPASILPSPTEWEATLAVAKQIASTAFVPKDYRGQPEAVVAAILAGRELGVGPMQALRDIHMIDGRPTFSANLMLAQMRKGGLSVVESSSTAERAWIRARRRDTGEEAEVEWTIEEARSITQKGKPLTDKDNWKNYPADMLWARAVGRLARRLGSDLMAGLVYSAEEMRDLEEGSYGVGTGYDATTAKPFDPGEDLLPGALQGDGFLVKLGDAFHALDPRVDWRGVIDQLEPNPDARGEVFWRRISNAVAKIGHDPNELPPPTDESILDAFAWAFDGLVIELHRPEVEAAQAELDEEAATAAVDESESAEDSPLSDEAVEEALKAEVDDVDF